MKARRLARTLPALAGLALALGFVACGVSNDEKTGLKEGEPVQLGDLQYSVQFSRFLNPNDVEDKEYLVGQPPPKPDQLYLGIFVQILNKSKTASVSIPAGWRITDTEHDSYLPLPSSSPYALPLGAPIGPEDQAPALDSTPQVGPIEGSMVLFAIPDAAIEDRPLILHIPGSGGPAEVKLDI